MKGSQKIAPIIKATIQSAISKRRFIPFYIKSNVQS